MLSLLSPLLSLSLPPQSINSLPSLVTWARLLCVVTMSAISRRKAGKGPAMCTVNGQELVGMGRAAWKPYNICGRSQIKTNASPRDGQATYIPGPSLSAFVNEVLLVPSHLLVYGLPVAVVKLNNCGKV